MPILPRSGSTSAGAGSGQALAYHLHGLTRSTIRSADGATDARWTDHDWQNAVERPLTALGTRWTAAASTGHRPEAAGRLPAPSPPTRPHLPTQPRLARRRRLGLRQRLRRGAYRPTRPPGKRARPADAGRRLGRTPRRARPPPARVPLRRRRPPHRPSPAVGCYRPTSTGWASPSPRPTATSATPPRHARACRIATAGGGRLAQDGVHPVGLIRRLRHAPGPGSHLARPSTTSSRRPSYAPWQTPSRRECRSGN